MIEAVYEDVKVQMASLVTDGVIVDSFLYLGEEHILDKMNPPRIVVTGSSETLMPGSAERDEQGRPVQPFAKSRMILKLYVFGRTYTEARLLVYSFLQALEKVTVVFSGENRQKYSILKEQCTISYDTWDEGRGYRMATATVPLQNIVMATEVTWVKLTQIIHECAGLME